MGEQVMDSKCGIETGDVWVVCVPTVEEDVKQIECDIFDEIAQKMVAVLKTNGVRTEIQPTAYSWFGGGFQQEEEAQIKTR